MLNSILDLVFLETLILFAIKLEVTKWKLDANGIRKFPHIKKNEKTHVTQTRNLARCGKATTIVFISIE